MTEDRIRLGANLTLSLQLFNPRNSGIKVGTVRREVD